MTNIHVYIYRTSKTLTRIQKYIGVCTKLTNLYWTCKSNRKREWERHLTRSMIKQFSGQLA